MSDTVLLALIAMMGPILMTFVTAYVARRFNTKLDWITTLVDGQMSAQQEAELVALNGQLAALMEIAELKRETGRELTTNGKVTIEALEVQISEKEAKHTEHEAALAAVENPPKG